MCPAYRAAAGIQPRLVSFLGASLFHVAEDTTAEATTAHLPLAGPVPEREPTAAEIRAWAQDVGLDVSDRGRIPADVRRRFEASRQR